MQGTVLQSQGQNDEAHEYYEGASAIEYAISGASYAFAKAQWRLVGSVMALGQVDKANEYLVRIRNLVCFQQLSKQIDGKKAFIDLTIRYAMPWWQDSANFQNVHQLKRMTKSVWALRR